jgi:hypothetical protein
MHSKFSIKPCHSHKQLKFDGQKITNCPNNVTIINVADKLLSPCMEIKNSCCVVLLTLGFIMLFTTRVETGEYYSHKLLYISVKIVTGSLSPYL